MRPRDLRDKTMNDNLMNKRIPNVIVITNELCKLKLLVEMFVHFKIESKH